MFDFNERDNSKQNESFFVWVCVSVLNTGGGDEEREREVDKTCKLNYQKKDATLKSR